MLSDKKIGTILKKARKRLGYSIDDLCAKLKDTSTATVSRLENGLKNLEEVERLLEICEILEIPKDEILGE